MTNTNRVAGVTDTERKTKIAHMRVLEQIVDGIAEYRRKKRMPDAGNRREVAREEKGEERKRRREPEREKTGVLHRESAELRSTWSRQMLGSQAALGLERSAELDIVARGSSDFPRVLHSCCIFRGLCLSLGRTFRAASLAGRFCISSLRRAAIRSECCGSSRKT